jgi:hypothetical protein
LLGAIGAKKWPQVIGTIKLPDAIGTNKLPERQFNASSHTDDCDLKQFFAAAGSNYLPQVQSKPIDFASPTCLGFVFWKH